MLAPLFFGTLAAMTPATSMPPAACADLAITSVKTTGVTHVPGGTDRYAIAVTVKNIGKAGQAGNTLDSVAMTVDEVKTDVKGLKVLAAGASQTLKFVVPRSTDAGAGTTEADFAIVFTHPECGPSNDTGKVTF